MLAAIDWTTLTSGLTGQVESGVTMALPVAAVIIGAGLIYKVIRRFVKA